MCNDCITDREKELSKISPWPWDNIKDGEGGFIVTRHKASIEGRHDVCCGLDYSLERDLANMNFIATAPEVEKKMIEEIKRLKEENKIMKEVLKDITEMNAGRCTADFMRHRASETLK